MKEGFDSFISLPKPDRWEVFARTANRLNTSPSNVEKDFWVCLVLDIVFNQLPKGHPRLLFKGGTSLSKGFGLIPRFSEDIDIVVFRDDLGFEDDLDPTLARNLSNRKRAALFNKLKEACSSYIRGDLLVALTKQLNEIVAGCHVFSDEDDVDRQTLLVEYPAPYPSDDKSYVVPRVKIEAGARSALEPSSNCTVSPYIADELLDCEFNVSDIRVIAPERTYWEKLLILHGAYCGYRDKQRLPTPDNRIARHYYDVAMLTDTDIGRKALSNVSLLDEVRKHNLIAFRQAWKRFDQAVPGSVKLVPGSTLRSNGIQLLKRMILRFSPAPTDCK